MSSPSRLSPPSRITNAYLKKLLKRVPKFRGVFACDLLPRRIGEGDTLILNTDPHYKPGEHYVAIYRKGGQTFYFDPLRFSAKDFFPIMHRNLVEANLAPLHHVLPGPIQAVDSTLCGLFCANYVLSRAFSDPKKLESYFQSSLHLNDAICLSNLKKRLAQRRR